MSEFETIVVETKGRIAIVTLNRPDNLNALTNAMCEDITKALLEWISDDTMEFILVDHVAGSRGFCAGGDVTMLAKSGKSDARDACIFFQTEYRLNDLISRYPKPYIAVMDGVTMGACAAHI